MDIVISLAEMIWSTVLPFLFVITVIVFVHEMGHFLVARFFGIHVSTFSIGFGPELCARVDSKGTRWRIAAIPLGGYVNFLGEESAAAPPVADTQDLAPEQAQVQAPDVDTGGRQADIRAFHTRSVGVRAAVVAAGPLANFIFAVVIFAALFMIFGKTDLPARIGQVEPASAAAEAGLEAGDTILAVDGEPIDTFGQLQRIVQISAGLVLQLEIERSGRTLTIAAAPRMQEIVNRLGEKQTVGLLGVSSMQAQDGLVQQSFSMPGALVEGASETVFIVSRTFLYLSDMIVGSQSADQLGGPIRIAELSGKVAERGFADLLSFAAVLSISIGLLNLFPIPILDGGYLLFYAIEVFRGRPLGAKLTSMSFRIGFATLMLIMIFATWNDIARWAQP